MHTPIDVKKRNADVRTRPVEFVPISLQLGARNPELGRFMVSAQHPNPSSAISTSTVTLVVLDPPSSPGTGISFCVFYTHFVNNVFHCSMVNDGVEFTDV